LKVPQADDVVKVADLPLAVAERVDTPEAVSNRYGFDRRQALYYLQAAEMLGLIVRHQKKYKLSTAGHRYVALTPPQRKELLTRKMLSLPIVAQIIVELLASPLHHLSRNQIESIASSRSGISGTTVARRVTSVFSWLSWLGEETEAFKVSKESVSMPIRP
jgi:hypothetical protein